MLSKIKKLILVTALIVPIGHTLQGCENSCPQGYDWSESLGKCVSRPGVSAGTRG